MEETKMEQVEDLILKSNELFQKGAVLIEKCQSEWETLGSDKQEIESRFNSLKEKYDSIKTQHDDLKGKADELKKRIKALETEKETQMADYAELSGKNVKLQETIKEKENRIQVLVNSVQTLKTTLDNVVKAVNTYGKT